MHSNSCNTINAKLKVRFPAIFHSFLNVNKSTWLKSAAVKMHTSTTTSTHTCGSLTETSNDTVLRDVTKGLTLIDDFISESEEQILYTEVQKYLKKLRYEFDHWDNVSTNLVTNFGVTKYCNQVTTITIL